RELRGGLMSNKYCQALVELRNKQGVNSPENVIRRAPLIAHFLQFMGWFVPQFHQRLAIFITH
ncbi:hypothetical protein ACT453_13650, partial [Bacillus sp. D-CC]